jgi:mRNA interferase MazF
VSRKARYVARQGDLVWVDFDPTRGREITKRRPALVVSSDAYNQSTGFVVVCPVTSTICATPVNHTLRDTSIQGQVITSQIRSLDVSTQSGRKIEFIEPLPSGQFGIIVQLVNHIFAFDPLFSR